LIPRGSVQQVVESLTGLLRLRDGVGRFVWRGRLIRDGDAWVEKVYCDDRKAVGLVLPGFTIPVPDLWRGREVEQPEGKTAEGVS
jgi:hypothetical protein